MQDISASVLAKFAEAARNPSRTLANPDENFKMTDFNQVPTRRLIWGGLSKDYCLIHYEHGGYAHTY